MRSGVIVCNVPIAATSTLKIIAVPAAAAIPIPNEENENNFDIVVSSAIPTDAKISSVPTEVPTPQLGPVVIAVAVVQRTLHPVIYAVLPDGTV